MSAALRGMFLALGAVFGFALSRSGAADFGFVQGMFQFTNLQLYGIIGAAVAVTAPGLWLLQRHGRTASGERVRFTVKSSHPGNLLGGALFGVGWAMTGMCPGPIFVNLGEGKLYALTLGPRRGLALRRDPRAHRAPAAALGAPPGAAVAELRARDRRSRRRSVPRRAAALEGRGARRAVDASATQ
ncbi:MAG: DUF6691 family protein [Polyangiales bacterium]